MRKFLNVIVLTAALAGPIALMADDHKVYQDERHHDKHEWNDDENHRYRTYLEEHHRKYRDFERLNRRDRDDYWKWRHDHEH